MCNLVYEHTFVKWTLKGQMSVLNKSAKDSVMAAQFAEVSRKGAGHSGSGNPCFQKMRGNTSNVKLLLVTKLLLIKVMRL